MAIVQNIDLNLIPDSEAVVVKVNQYDDGTGRIQAHLYMNDTAYTPASGATVRIEGTKPDKHGFSYTASISGNTVTANLTTQMTAVAGRTRAQIIVEEPSGKTGTFAFWLDVQAAALADDTDISDTELPAIMDLARQNAAIASAAAESAAASATTAQTAAQGTEGYAEDSEAYAVGKRGGTDVPNTDPTYHNNSKYYAGQAGTAAQSAQASAEAAAVWSEHPPYIGANGNWYIYNTTTHAFVDSGIDASITVQVADVTMLDPTATPYVTNTGSNTDPIFHLFLPRGQTGAPGQDGEDGVDGQDGQDGEDGVGIASIVKTGSQTVSGRVVDTYTITYTDNTTTTYQIVNGKDGADGQGSGDMTKAVYDPNDNRYPLNIMTGATASSAGTVGFLPAPGPGDQGKFFKGDGTWAETGSGDANGEEIAPVEETTTASQAYAVNDFLINDGKLYRVTSSIAIGGTITPGTNCTETSVSEAFVRKTGDTMTGNLTVAGEITDGQGNVLSKVDNRVATMPTASASNAGNIVQYVGATTASYTTGYFYKCQESSGTYSWVQIDVQPSGGDPQDIFIAEYDVTTYADINAAYTAGKFILVSRSLNGTTMYALSDKTADGTYYFRSFSNSSNTNYECYITSSGTWAVNSYSYAALSSPAFTGTPTAPTAAAGTNTTQIATTAFVNTAIGSAPKMPNYSALMALAVVSGTTIEFDNPYPVSEQSKLDESIIDGPYINNVMAGIEDVEIANNKIVYTLSDDSADTCLAIIWVRYAGQLLLNDLVETSLQRTYSNDSISSSSTSDEIKAKFKSSGGQLTAYFGSHGITVTDDCIYSYSRSESISESGASYTYYYANASYTSDNITETTEVIVARFGGRY